FNFEPFKIDLKMNYLISIPEEIIQEIMLYFDLNTKALLHMTHKVFDKFIDEYKNTIDFNYAIKYNNPNFIFLSREAGFNENMTNEYFEKMIKYCDYNFFVKIVDVKKCAAFI